MDDSDTSCLAINMTFNRLGFPADLRGPDTKTALLVMLQLTDFSRIVLLEPIVPGPCRSQATRQCGNALHYIELRYKLC